MAFSFFGGVHPKENKHYAEDRKILGFPEPDILVIPMSQHIGAPCAPLVKKGDHVTVGQKIGDNQGLCVPVHASVSGTVKAVENRPHSNGTMMMSVVIENDHKNELCPDIKPRTQEEVDALTPEDLMAIIDLDRQNSYIANIVKCRPPHNRDPLETEQEACIDYLRNQVALIKPKIIVCLGRIAAKRIIDPDFRITRQHGTWVQKGGIWMTAIYHPSALLRDVSKRPETFEDLLSIRDKITEVRANI